uniref:Uncharacterized protein n=3 Tax=Aegilops tauschii subsp. strangulata TaxID=200361 RepID=A0A453EK62_AEGTS
SDPTAASMDGPSQVTVIHGDLSAFQEEIQSVHHVVRTLETKLGRLAYTQDHTTRGIHELCEFSKRLDRSPKPILLRSQHQLLSLQSSLQKELPGPLLCRQVRNPCLL